GAAVDRVQYGYDPDGNVRYRANPAAAAAGQPFDEVYRYDGLNRLTDFRRGQLNPTRDGLTGDPTRAQTWQLDALGNWTAVTTDGVAQARTHDPQNQIQSIDGATTPGYDPNGNTLIDDAGRHYWYDAWDRVVQVTDPSGNLLASYSYDGLGRR